MRKPMCHSVRPLLPAYAARELDSALTTLVREHLRACALCAAEAAEIQHAFDALRAAEPAPAQTPPALSPHRRKRTLWMMANPVFGWFFLHRHITGIICAVVFVAAVIGLLFTIRYPDIFKLRRISVMIQAKPADQQDLQALDPPPVKSDIQPPEYIPPAPVPDDYEYDESP